MKRSNLLVLAVALLISASSAFAQATNSESKPDGNPETPAKQVKIAENMNFVLRDALGEDVNFKNLLGKGPVLLNFWALWCEPCKQEMKAFKAIAEKLKDQGVTMVAINTDKVKSVAKVRAYVTTQELGFPVLLDPDGGIARDIFAMESLPYSLILNPDGTVYKRHVGYTAGDEVKTEEALTELIEKLKSK
jgi:peroxiredoxin